MAQRWCRDRNGMEYIETSSKEAINVELAFTKIAELVARKDKHVRIRQ